MRLRADPETGYLLACLAHGLDSNRPWPHPPRGLDWKRLLALLDRHRLAGFFHALGKSHSESWPREFQESLRSERYRWMAHGGKSRARVHSALMALRSGGVEVIVLKGWAFISTLYNGDASQRLCEDVDLLVRPRDVDRAEAILRSLGCALHLVVWPGYDHRFHNGERFFFSNDPIGQGDPFSIGLHWGLFHTPSYDPTQVDVDALFERARPLNVADVPVLELSREDAILYACGHIALHHRFDDALFRSFELAWLIHNAAGPDWETAARRASQWRLLIPVRRGLERLTRLWPDLVPDSAVEAFRRPIASRRERLVDFWLSHARALPGNELLLRWLTFHDWKRRPLLVFQDIFPGPDYLKGRYGPPPLGFWPFLYFLRLARAVGQLIRRGD